ncbi:hypothetical protein HH800_02355 [Sphingobium yanoikuyae]|uniref:Uncharacterized protein n=1 Tax=Sphingobium yanoikuyae TaxID=13690 RepID=A0A6M4G1J6_SPHYA|nr:hypothetical protein [Sphingobium yanoikuyae]QJR01141.1 hypothetical protein HH800_02355 [Sphingobium yanoikuyae]
MAITRDLFAARNRAFDTVLELDYPGDELPLTGAIISMQVRLYAGAGGPPIFEQTGITFSDAAIEDEPGWRRLTVEPNFPRSDLEAGTVPTGLNKPEVGEADRFEYEITLTYADSVQETLWTGGFYLQPGVDLT